MRNFKELSHRSARSFEFFRFRSFQAFLSCAAAPEDLPVQRSLLTQVNTSQAHPVIEIRRNGSLQDFCLRIWEPRNPARAEEFSCFTPIRAHSNASKPTHPRVNPLAPDLVNQLHAQQLTRSWAAGARDKFVQWIRLAEQRQQRGKAPPTRAGQTVAGACALHALAAGSD